MICHVLRYSSFFSRIKKSIEEDRLGRLISIQHIEEVGYWHHAHSFLVRGNWRRSDETSPMILQNAAMIWIFFCGWQEAPVRRSALLKI